jgi:DNA adenine methylase
MSKIQKLINSGVISQVETEKQKDKANNDSSLLPEPILDFPKPILKWVGGKTQILEKVVCNFPKSINNYHEIFLGGGSVLFGVLHLVNLNKIKINGTINAYDLNFDLINMYKTIQSKPKELYQEVKKLIDDYNGIEDSDEDKNKKPTNREEGLTSKESYYFWVRKQFNQKSTTKDSKSKKDQTETNDIIKKSAMFIFLNKTCFRGLYRVGPNGFNVPYGNYKNPTILDESHLKQISKLIKNVNFYHMDFSESLKKPVNGDFVYMDPPYAPENEKSFVGYTDGGFGLEKHNQLFSLSNQLKKSNVKFMMSNADVKLVRDNFKDVNIESIDCKRSINSKNPGSKTKEVIIKSYSS